MLHGEQNSAWRRIFWGSVRHSAELQLFVVALGVELAVWCLLR